MFDFIGVRFVPPISENKQNFHNDQKSWENRTNMDMILLFLAKPLDKHGILASVSFSPLLIIESVARVSQLALIKHELLVKQV